MRSKNSYTGINPEFVRGIKSETRSLKMHPVYAHKDLEDLEQELFLECLPVLDSFKGDDEKFIRNHIKCRARNLLEKELCKKRAINFVDETLYEEGNENFEYSVAVRIDLNEAIAKLPKEIREVYDLLDEGYNACEISRKTGIPKSTVYDRIDKLGKDLSPLEIYLKQDFQFDIAR